MKRFIPRWLSEPDSSSFSARDLVVTAVWTAVWLGMVEAGLLLFARFGLGRYTHVNPQNIWMTPLFYGVVSLVVTGLVLGVFRARSRARAQGVLFLSAWLGAVGVLLLLTRLHQLAVLVLALGVAVQYARFVADHPTLTRKVVRPTSWIAGAAIIGGFLVLNGGRVLREELRTAGLNPDPAMPNVLLIILDTVRAASMGMYGSDRNTTPHLTERARDGLVFENAFAVAPWTLPSHASLFTGRWPNELSADWRSPLDAAEPTLAELLSARGYRTGGFVANTFYVSRESGLARGFLHYEAYPIWSPGHFMTASSISRALLGRHDFRRFFGIDEEAGRRTAPRIRNRFLAWQAEADQPFFAFLNFYDAHAPYLPPAPFDTLFGPRLPDRDPSMKEGRKFSARELQAEIDAYDGAIAYLDAQLELLFRELEDRGVLRNTLVVVTSDHGEEFGEHGVFTHSNSLYREGVHVPLMLFFPDRIPEGRRIADWVSIRDVPATILDLLGIDGNLSGRSLARRWDGTRSPPDTLLALVSHASGRPAAYPVSRGDMYSAMAEPYRYIINGDGEEELYELSTDPRERQNIVNDTAVLPIRTSFSEKIAGALRLDRHGTASDATLEVVHAGRAASRRGSDAGSVAKVRR